MARTTRKERMERRQVALQKVSNGMGISEVVDFVSTEWGCSRRTARRDCHWALEELQLGLDTHDLAHLISHMATTLQRVSLKAEMSGQYASAIGAQRLLYDLLVSRRLGADAKKAELFWLIRTIVLVIALHIPQLTDKGSRPGSTSRSCRAQLS